MAKCSPGCTCKRHRSGPRSAEIAAKISAAKMGHPVSAETRAKISVAFRGRQQSAEAIKRRRAALRRHGHGGRTGRTPEYRAWSAMRQRCLNPASQRYASYGGRGITVCDRWSSFEAFLADMGAKPEPKEQYSLDRIDNDRGYEPGNCRWATRSEQQRNRPNYNPRKRTRRSR
jgi:hypothetical protein